MVSAQAPRIILNSERIHGTSNTSSASIQSMGIDHRRLHVAMAQKFLGDSDIVAIFQQISGKGMRRIFLFLLLMQTQLTKKSILI